MTWNTRSIDASGITGAAASTMTGALHGRGTDDATTTEGQKMLAGEPALRASEKESFCLRVQAGSHPSADQDVFSVDINALGLA